VQPLSNRAHPLQDCAGDGGWLVDRTHGERREEVLQRLVSLVRGRIYEGALDLGQQQGALVRRGAWGTRRCWRWDCARDRWLRCFNWNDGRLMSRGRLYGRKGTWPRLGGIRLWRWRTATARR
jgi:hypothetical protein